MSWPNFFKKDLKSPSILTLVLIIGLTRLCDTIFMPALPQISMDFGVTANVVQLSITVYLTAVCLTFLIWGYIADQFGRRNAFLASSLITIIGAVFCFSAWSYEIFFIGRFIQGIGSSAASVLVQTLARDVYEGEKRAQVYATMGMLVPLVPALGPFLGGVIDEVFHWRMIFFFSVSTLSLFTGYFFLRVKETQNKKSKPAEIKLHSVIKLLSKDREFIGFFLLMGCAMSVTTVNAAETSFIFIKLFGFSPGQFGVLGAGIALMSAVGGFFSKRMLKQGVKSLSIIMWAIRGWVSVSIFYLLISIIGLTSPSMGHFGLVCNTILICLMGLMGGVIGPNAIFGISHKHPQQAATVSAVFTLGYFMVANLASILISLVHDGTTHALPIVHCCIVALAIIAYRFFLGSDKSGAAGEN
ncbi:MAG: hypothetical protein CMM87_05775 [Rickettsiales bacterium]|nr:hypothetical protein [Rickettsiales bacterium]|tara:strand:+ start:24046 stop:25287 length:1242 start_codon:yes stop_codon:yes gene_type:complete